MKKLLFLLIISFSISVYAQDSEFILTPEGFRDKNDNSKDYVVINTKGAQAELYSKVKMNISTRYRSPKDVLSESYPDMITITGYSENAIFPNALITYEMDYVINIKFKDDKIRIDAPFFELYTYIDDKRANLLLAGTANLGLGAETNKYIYNKKGELKVKQAPVQLQDFFNSFIRDLTLSTNNKNNW